MSEAVERKIISLLSDHSISPFGIPVPGLELLGLEPAKTEVCQPISNVKTGNYRLSRIGEPIQVDTELLGQLKELSLLPGNDVVITKLETGWLVVLEKQDQGLVVDEKLAAHLFVETK